MKTAILSLIISLAVAILSVFQFERYQKLSDDLYTKIASFEKKMADTLAIMNQTQAKQEQQINEISVKEAQLKNMTAGNVSESANALAVNTPENTLENTENFKNPLSSENFKISQAYFFTELAQKRLQTTYDLEGARRLLDKAQANLQKINNPAYKGIRDQITKKMDELSATHLPNIDEIWGTINTLSEKINSLPTKGLRANSIESPLAEKKLNNQTNEKIQWRQLLAKTWEEMKDLIKIQRHTKPIDPILSKEEQLLAQEHLRLLLEQMRWAVLHNNQIVYERSIQESLQWTQNYFETKESQVKNFEESLNVLAKLNVKPNIPDLNPILQRFAEQDNP